MKCRMLEPLRPRVHPLQTAILSERFRKLSHEVGLYLYSPVHSCLKFSAVLQKWSSFIGALRSKSWLAYFGTISLKSSILSLPAGVSPICISIKTMGRVVEDMMEVLKRVYINRRFNYRTHSHNHSQLVRISSFQARGLS